MTDFKSAMRRIITGDDADGRSVIILDGGPSESSGDTILNRFAIRISSDDLPQGWR